MKNPTRNSGRAAQLQRAPAGGALLGAAALQHHSVTVPVPANQGMLMEAISALERRIDEAFASAAILEDALVPVLEPVPPGDTSATPVAPAPNSQAVNDVHRFAERVEQLAIRLNHIRSRVQA